MQVLCGDIGGTNTRLALASINDETVEIDHQTRYPSSAYNSLEEIITEFLQHRATPQLAALGAAGPVRNGHCDLTNLDWNADEETLRQTFGFRRASLLNDLEAIAWGIETLQTTDLVVLQAGSPDPGGNQSVIAAGTGLGEAGIQLSAGRRHCFASEGGHADFAPSNESEFRLFQFLKGKYGHVSWERCASGTGLVDVFDFMLSEQKQPIPAWFEQACKEGDPAASIAMRADAGTCPVCEACMRLFVQLYAREAGNHALKIMATGGVYLAGGIAPKILPRLKSAEFLQTFNDKGRMRPLMESMPVKVVMNDNTGLQGAAWYAARD